MRLSPIAIVVALVSTTLACASRPAEPPKAPEPIAYDRADFTPQDEWTMHVETANEGPAIKRSAPSATSYQVNLASKDRE
jgi:hypothetical protein